MNSYRRISVHDADSLLHHCKETLLIDARCPQQFSENHHPQAISLNDRLVKTLCLSKKKDTPIIIYCDTGNTSKSIAKMFSEFGFKHCYSIDGGYHAWKHQVFKKFPLSLNLNRWLLHQGFNIQDINSRVNQENNTALMLAAKTGNSRIVYDLIEAGANPNLTDIYGNNALWFACLSQNIEIVKTLINADVEVDNINAKGFTAINYVVGITEFIELLQQYSSNARPLHAPNHKTTSLPAVPHSENYVHDYL